MVFETSFQNFEKPFPNFKTWKNKASINVLIVSRGLGILFHLFIHKQNLVCCKFDGQTYNVSEDVMELAERSRL